MKKFALSATLAVACAGAAFAPSVVAHAQGTPTERTGNATRTIALQNASDREASIQAAAADTGSFISPLGLSSDDTLTVKDVVTDTDGSTHVRLARAFKGIPVVGGDLIVHRDPAGRVTSHSGMFDGPITVSTTPTLTAAQAQPKGLAAARSSAREDGLNNASSSTGRLVIHVSDEGRQRLAYLVQTEGFADDKTPSRIQSFIDADSGADLDSFDTIAHADGNGVFTGKVQLSTTKSGSGYSLTNPETGGSTSNSGNKKVTGSVFTSTTDSWGDGTADDPASAAVDAQFGADKTFEFYKNVLGRAGIWNNGKGAPSRVHYDDNYENAFWDGKQMTYGDGANNAHPLTEIDVAAHEMSHGVTENTANLNYSGDAGGLNEATSDIFGAAVEWYANLSVDTPDYFMGEQIDLNGDGTPLRYMDKPSKDGKSPDCWSGTVSTMDPHYSSGPLNHWFYLASEGSGAKTINGVKYDSPTCNSSTVKGTGHEDVEKIWYRTLSTKLTSSSTYRNAREGAIQSAVEMYGQGSQQCLSVESAFDAIAVPKGSASCGSGPAPTPTPTPDPTTPAPTPTPTSTPTPDPTTPAPAPGPIAGGDFEGGMGSWTGTGTVSTDSAIPAHSGTGKLVLTGNANVSQTVTVPKGASTLSLWVLNAGQGIKGSNLKVQMYDPAVRVGYNLDNITGSSISSGAYTQKTFKVGYYAGKQMQIRLVSSGSGVLAVDDVDMK